MTREIYVLVRCIACKRERRIYAGGHPTDETPMCDKCFSPMVAIGAGSSEK